MDSAWVLMLNKTAWLGTILLSVVVAIYLQHELVEKKHPNTEKLSVSVTVPQYGGRRIKNLESSWHRELYRNQERTEHSIGSDITLHVYISLKKTGLFFSGTLSNILKNMTYLVQLLNWLWYYYSYTAPILFPNVLCACVQKCDCQTIYIFYSFVCIYIKNLFPNNDSEYHSGEAF